MIYRYILLIGGAGSDRNHIIPLMLSRYVSFSFNWQEAIVDICW